ncbi:MAG: hypothetical protein MJE68_09865, partial [Proteobacteria bacterium]|nr:hypothetical protein [Pseudomonadota bacterium]
TFACTEPRSKFHFSRMRKTMFVNQPANLCTSCCFWARELRTLSHDHHGISLIVRLWGVREHDAVRYVDFMQLQQFTVHFADRPV